MVEIGARNLILNGLNSFVYSKMFSGYDVNQKYFAIGSMDFGITQFF